MIPKVFVASSVEGLEIAYAVQEELSLKAEVTVWSQVAFRITQDGLSTLLTTARQFDAAIFVLTEDDLVATRGSGPGPRDNIVLELGLFIGAIGRSRVFVLTWGTADRPALPSDLTGISFSSVGSRDANPRAGVVPFCRQVLSALGLLAGIEAGTARTTASRDHDLEYFAQPNCSSGPESFASWQPNRWAFSSAE